MPKKARSPEEVRAVKQRILDKALDLINEDGFKNFTMRKLANKLNMTATPIYTYYKNKDELYLSILIQGFEKLYKILEAAYKTGKDPLERLKNVCREYISFGIYSANFYNIMLVFDVPKFYDYIGSPSEKIAALEMEAAIKVRDFGIKVIKESGFAKGQDPETANMLIVELLCSMHGFISINNSQIVDYLIQPGTGKISDELIDSYVELIAMKI